MEQLILFIVLLILGYSVGRIAESRHYRSIETREKEFLSLPAVTIKHALDPQRDVAAARLVAGNVVISVDYFKRFLAGLRNLFGGNVMSYETLIDRARREATLRMKEAAKGAHIILNFRIETSSISKGRKNSVGSIEAMAYGTAITYRTGSARTTSASTAASPQPAAPAPVPPAEPQYKVTFSGDLADGEDLETVKARIAALYKVPVERCDHLFAGQTVTIKGKLTYQTAQKYKAAFERTGARCSIETE